MAGRIIPVTVPTPWNILPRPPNAASVVVVIVVDFLRRLNVQEPDPDDDYDNRYADNDNEPKESKPPTQCPYGEWDKTFANDNAIASAITDRLVHRSRTFILTGESRRLHEHQTNSPPA